MFIEEGVFLKLYSFKQKMGEMDIGSGKILLKLSVSLDFYTKTQIWAIKGALSSARKPPGPTMEQFT